MRLCWGNCFFNLRPPPHVCPWNVIKIPSIDFFLPLLPGIMFTQVSIRRRIWLPNFSSPPWGPCVSQPHMDTELESRLLIIPQHTQTPRAHILKSHIDLCFRVPLPCCPASAFLSAKEKKELHSSIYRQDVQCKEHCVRR